jgi:hypothetical protein
MSFRVLGLSSDQFRPFFAMPDAMLHRTGARRVIAGDGMPCRVSMEHAEPGEELLLINFEHQSANTPYRSTHAIYVRRIADRAFDAVNIVPEVLAKRLLSVRAFDSHHMMINADVCDGVNAAELFERLLADPQTSYLHVHNARRGCYAARVERA